MKPLPYPTLDALDAAIAAGKITSEQVRAFFDGGEVIINNNKGETLYRVSEQQALIELLDVFMGIKHEII